MIFTPEQQGLRDAVAALLAKRSDSAAVRRAIGTDTGYDVELWQVLCDQIGVAALAIPDRWGGADASPTEAHIVFGELGRMLTPSPMLGTYLAAQLLLALGDSDACARLLPRIASGEIVAVAWADETGWHDGAVTFADGALHGTAHYVLDGDLAQALLVVTPSGIVEVEDPAGAGVTRVHTHTMDPTRRLARVTFDGVRGRAIAGDGGAALQLARDHVWVALSAEQAGAASRLLELTVEYSKVRVQFGRPIGSFQALKHRMADLYVLVESARSASYAALAGTIDARVAKAACSEAVSTVAAEAIQLHGGIAITWEHDAQLYFKRAHGSAALFGSPSEHIAAMAVMAGIEDA